MPLGFVIFGLVAGPTLLALALWFRIGRSSWAREWVDGDASHQQGLLLTLPGGGLFVLAWGFTQWDVTVGLAVLLLLLGCVLIFWGAFGPRVPEWFKPRWARKARASGKGAEQ